jgi:regulatory protein YycH of two-component signal transduction system YycFG
VGICRGNYRDAIEECRNVNLMDQKVIRDEANENKQKWNVNKITSLRYTKIIYLASYFTLFESIHNSLEFDIFNRLMLS